MFFGVVQLHYSQSCLHLVYLATHSYSEQLGPVAQRIRHLTTNQGIAGSNPARVKIFLHIQLYMHLLLEKNIAPPGGLEPPTFRLTAERASRLRHGGKLCYCCVLCHVMKTFFNLTKIFPTRMGFEPTRAEPIGLAVQRLNHSATSSLWQTAR